MTKGLDIDTFLDNKSEIPLIDVRSPFEFDKGHIPGAYNIPLFDNKERKDVGVCYKENGRDAAVRLGLDIVGPKMGKIVDDCIEISPEKKILVYCWRGGMRSQKTAWLLSTAGFNVVDFLENGYKEYRKNAFKLFEDPWKIVVLGGFTGSGKTEILHHFQNEGTQVLDLESMAKHKGSAFGAISDEKQPSVEHFENVLANELRQFDINKPIVLEDESRNIGSIKIPDQFFKKMRDVCVYFLDIPKKERAENLSRCYGNIDDEFIIKKIRFLERKLGGQNSKQAIKDVENRDYAKAAEIILNYYDKSYLVGLSKRAQDRIVNISSDSCQASKNFELLKKVFYDKF